MKNLFLHQNGKHNNHQNSKKLLRIHPLLSLHENDASTFPEIDEFNTEKRANEREREKWTRNIIKRLSDQTSDSLLRKK